MRIAMVAPIGERVPPEGYGGTERMVSWLTEGLVRRGHEVTLYATGDSQTAARLRGWPGKPLRGRTPACGHAVMELAHVLRVEPELERVDLVHCHLGIEAAALTRDWMRPVLHTLHGGIFPWMVPAMQALKDLSWVAISDAQRQPVPGANWVATIPHGIPVEALPFVATKDDYVLHLGRIAPEKGTHIAIDAAVQARVRLIIAAKVDPANQGYFDDEIKPRLQHPRVNFVGEVGDLAKGGLLGHARALLFPICWDEPFGLVLAEALATGTPVIAFSRGSVPEIITDGVTGLLVDDVAGMAAAIGSVGLLDPEVCRRHAEERFSLGRMVTQYERLFADVMAVAVAC